jgi:hypothetical protein
MCSGDEHNCPQFELHGKKLLDDLDGERRSFLKSAFVAGGGAAAWAASGTLTSPASAQTRAGQPTYHYLPATADTVHWGYFSKLLKPQLEVESRDYVTIEVVTHHAGDDTERMVKAIRASRAFICGPRTRKASIAAAPGRSTASCSGAAPARASVCTYAPVRSISAARRRSPAPPDSRTAPSARRRASWRPCHPCQ